MSERRATGDRTDMHRYIVMHNGRGREVSKISDHEEFRARYDGREIGFLDGVGVRVGVAGEVYDPAKLELFDAAEGGK